MKSLKIFISGCTPYANNRGVSALFRGCVELLKRTFPQKRINLIIWHTPPESLVRLKKKVATSDLSNLGENVSIKVIPCNPPPNILYFYMHLIICIMIKIMTFIFKIKKTGIELLDEIETSNFIIELNFGDVPAMDSKSFMLNMLRLILFRLSKKKIFMLSQTISCESQIKRILLGISIKWAEIITVREKSSLICVRQIKNKGCYLIPDIGFLTPPNPPPENITLLIESLRKENTPIIGIIPDPSIEPLKLANTIELLIRKINAKILLIPHVTYLYAHPLNSCRNESDPLKYMLRVKERLRVPIYILCEEFTVEQLWGIFKLCDVVISLRMHGTIGCLRSSVPTIMIGETIKSSHLMKFFGISKYLLHSDFDEEDCVRLVVDCLRNSRILKVQISKCLNSINQRIMKLCELLNAKIEV